MDKKALIKAIENMPDEAGVFIDAGFFNLIEVNNVKYDSDQNIIVIE